MIYFGGPLTMRRSAPIVFLVLLLMCLPARSQNPPVAPPTRQQFLQKLVEAAIERTHHSVRYDPAYVRIPYPNGDVPAETGVCTDEIIRAYRAVGIDLQKEVHEDMLHNFSAYPNQRRWLLAHTDTNIDHRRVPNLMTFFTRKGERLPVSARSEDYIAGDLVTWDLGGNVPHIGIVVNLKSAGTGRYLIVHNIGRGPKMEDVLFNWKITGHYRYFGPAH
jgi:uncharacterized protein YijF (DUF1287 family)